MMTMKFSNSKIQEAVKNAINGLNKKVETEILKAILDNPTTCPIELPSVNMFGNLEVQLFYLRDLDREPLWYYLMKLTK